MAANLISLSYLWNAVRVRGGAYGAGMNVAANGSFFCYSYRDPSPAKSLDTYDGCADFLEEFASGDEELDKFIISTVAASEPLKTPREWGAAADAIYLSDLTEDERKKTRREILATDRDAILRLCPALREMAKSGRSCVVGGTVVEGLEKIEI